MGDAFVGSGYMQTAFGKSIAMDGSGSRIIMGAEYGGWAHGQVFIYYYTDTTDTLNMGTIISIRFING